jgi:hypothetical protein
MASPLGGGVPLNTYPSCPGHKSRAVRALRVSELTGIDMEDLDLDGESVKVTGKGSRVRMAYFGSKTGACPGKTPWPSPRSAPGVSARARQFSSKRMWNGTAART